MGDKTAVAKFADEPVGEDDKNVEGDPVGELGAGGATKERDEEHEKGKDVDPAADGGAEDDTMFAPVHKTEEAAEGTPVAGNISWGLGGGCGHVRVSCRVLKSS